jgi:carboxymethylenebutenolidase
MFGRVMKLFSLTLLVFSVLAGCAAVPDEMMPENSTETLVSVSDEMAEGMVSYYPGKPEVKGYLAVPKGNGNYPGIILIHEWWGLNDDIRQKADEFAAEGYVALAVDLYDGKYGSTPDEARELATQVRENVGEAFNNLSAALDYLRGLDMVNDDQLASVGWCFGGQWSYEMAKNNLGTKVSIMYYGRFSAEDDLSQMKALILGHFGEEDASITVDSVEEFQITLGKNDSRHEIYIYENAGHAFANEDSDAYVEEAAQQAWDRSLNFLREYL